MIKIGLVGCGNIGAQLAVHIQKKLRTQATLVSIWDNDSQTAQKLQTVLRKKIISVSIAQLVSQSDLIIEAASADAVQQLLPLVIKKKKQLMVLSSGGLLRNPARLAQAIRARTPIFLPSGALAGLDGIKSARVGKIRSVTLTTRKPPLSFSGAPGVQNKKLRLESIRKPTVIFDGNALKAARLFPQNINVAATLALAGVGAARTRVRIIADPGIKNNSHTIESVGDFGILISRTENRPSVRNRKTSQLAVYSAIATLEQILNPLQVGS